MTIKVNFKPGGSYDQTDLINQFMSLFSDGVNQGLQVVECSPASLNVNVASGSLMCSGYFFYNDATVTVPIQTNTSGYTRIDTLCVSITDENFTVVQGIPSSSPVAPTISDSMLFPLANITIGNNVSVLNNNTIQIVSPPNEFRIGGLTFKFGKSPFNTNPTGQATANVTFDTPFSNGCKYVLAIDNGGAAYSYGTTGYSKTGFTWWASVSNTLTVAPIYLAIGY
ncbi:gp53-like domain-containing protein [Clostridium pasteurianum]|uniref:Putative tail fiber protein gp53-like C-terminal domain-containing protein n=1 Tax=Clostridium pasteurianum BC1 TaxID=86416 RepID=R4KDC3_CLOPA|nr:hypothetical protein [Clostridium pasteurianum]AGK97620.1 hypothetical protein Clopa_2782 [Clostridium pasteurianum BC1]